MNRFFLGLVALLAFAASSCSSGDVSLYRPPLSATPIPNAQSFIYTNATPLGSIDGVLVEALGGITAKDPNSNTSSSLIFLGTSATASTKATISEIEVLGANGQNAALYVNSLQQIVGISFAGSTDYDTINYAGGDTIIDECHQGGILFGQTIISGGTATQTASNGVCGSVSLDIQRSRSLPKRRPAVHSDKVRDLTLCADNDVISQVSNGLVQSLLSILKGLSAQCQAGNVAACLVGAAEALVLETLISTPGVCVSPDDTPPTPAPLDSDCGSSSTERSRTDQTTCALPPWLGPTPAASDEPAETPTPEESPSPTPSPTPTPTPTPTATATPTPSATPSETASPTLEVPATQPLTDTGIVVVAGEQISFAATGNAIYSPQYPAVGPDGIPLSNEQCSYYSQNGDFYAPALSCWSLIGEIGQGSSPFEVGSSLQITAPTSGELYLGFNDETRGTGYADNSGGFEVTISYPSGTQSKRRSTTLELRANLIAPR